MKRYLYNLIASAIALIFCCQTLWAEPVSEPSIAMADDSAEDSGDDFLDLDITQLRNTSVAPAFDEVVTTVSRQESTVGRSPAAVYVITQEMIRRSGVRSVPEALRLAPGVNVAKVDGNKWAISIRGFQDRYANKLLVQIDGRSVYNNAFSGVYWDVQDLLLDDIARIEVIRGPGATVWGSNAVNGVINVITKVAKDTTGFYAIAGGGTEEEGFTGARIGGAAAGGNLHWRVSGKWFERDATFAGPFPAADETQQGRGGYRVDWTPNTQDTLTLQGDIYRGESGSLLFLPPTLSSAEEQVQGAHVLGRWTRDYDEDHAFSLQWYLDQSIRRGPQINLRWDVFDIDFQHRSRLAKNHNLIWGLRYRHTEDELLAIAAPPITSYDPVSRFVDMYSGFAQDEMTLVEDKLYFTLGTKLELNQFTDWEWQPSARMLAVIDERRVAWAAVSRAVRTPNNTERDSTNDLSTVFGIPFTLLGNRAFDSETLMSYELGYRAQPKEFFSWEAALFFYKFDKIVDPVPIGASTFRFANNGNGEVYGIELNGTLDMSEDWQIISHYSFARSVANGDVFNSDGVFNHPRNQAYLRSAWNLTPKTEFDMTARYTDNLGGAISNVPSYLTMDIRLGWRPNKRLELAVVGQNLLDAEQLEAFDRSLGLVSTQVQRGVYGSITWRY